MKNDNIFCFQTGPVNKSGFHHRAMGESVGFFVAGAGKNGLIFGKSPRSARR